MAVLHRGPRPPPHEARNCLSRVSFPGGGGGGRVPAQVWVKDGSSCALEGPPTGG